MSSIVLLDSTPLGLVTNPKGGADAVACSAWVTSLLDAGITIALPEIIDYELRRELIRANKGNGLRRLEAFKGASLYLPITTPVMLKAAEFWAYLRQQGARGAPDDALDGDVILAAQAWALGEEGYSVVVATDNVKHLYRIADAHDWPTITLESLQA